MSLFLVGGMVIGLMAIFFAFSSSSKHCAANDFALSSVKQAKEWIEQSKNAKNKTERLIASTRAYTYLTAATLALKLDEIEKISKMNVSDLQADIEKTHLKNVEDTEPSLMSSAAINVMR